MQEQSSISIINKNNGALTGENAKALPIQLVGFNQKRRWFLFGFFTCAIIVGVAAFFAKRGVAVINVEQKATEFTEYSI